MAKIEFTKTEIRSIRRQISTSLDENLLPDYVINDDLVISDASDYVFERLREHMLTSGEAYNRLNFSAQTAIENVLTRVVGDDTQQLTNFIEIVLQPPQRKMFRRSVQYRVAGDLIPTVPQLLSERGGSVEQRYQETKWETLQTRLYHKSDEKITQIRNAFPNDIFVNVQRETSELTIFDIVSN